MDWQQRVHTWTSKNSRLVGIVLVLFFGIGSTIALISIPISGSEQPADWLAFALIWAVAICAYWNRTYPLQALLGAVTFMAVYWISDYPGGTEPAAWLLFYSATRHGGDDRRRVWRTVAVGLGIITIVATIGVIVSTEDLPALAILGLFVLHGTFAAIGEAFYQRSRYVEQLEQRAADLEADLENKAALAAVEERTRIAREMHDIIAHGMSTVVVQAQAAQSVVDTNPDKVREVLETIENIGRSSVDEMRRMLGVLRSNANEVELEPQPGFALLEELRSQVDVAGVDVDLMVVGDLTMLPPGIELTGYRIVQEALTNVLRHAGRPVQVTARIDCGDRELAITVTDNGLGAAAPVERAGSGHGLRGMRERVDIYNGTFQSGPKPGGGFEVHAKLPLPAKVSA